MDTYTEPNTTKADKIVHSTSVNGDKSGLYSVPYNRDVNPDCMSQVCGAGAKTDSNCNTTVAKDYVNADIEANGTLVKNKSHNVKCNSEEPIEMVENDLYVPGESKDNEDCMNLVENDVYIPGENIDKGECVNLVENDVYVTDDNIFEKT